MPVYGYKCPVCNADVDVIKSMADSKKVESCPTCGEKMIRTIDVVNISGTRDSFGIKNSFINEDTGKEITTWKEWEKAGYKQGKDVVGRKSDKAREEFNRKKDKLNNKVVA